MCFSVNRYILQQCHRQASVSGKPFVESPLIEKEEVLKEQEKEKLPEDRVLPGTGNT